MTVETKPKRKRRRRKKTNEGERGFEAVHSVVDKDHWRCVTDQPINHVVAGDLPTLRKRCEYELQNNPMVAGVVETHTIDLLGRSGPTLQVHSENDRYNRLLEEIVAEWFSNCTVDHESGDSIVDVLSRFNANDWVRGNSLLQWLDMSNELPGESIIKTRVMEIAPRRLASPFGFGFEQNIFHGVELDSLDRPKRYWILPSANRRQFEAVPTPYTRDDMLHWFDKKEPGQVIGWPLLASCLNEIAETRDYDTQVLDAARVAADNSFLLTTTMPQHMKGSKTPLVTGTEISMPRRSAKVMPAGYIPTQMTAQQPIANYAEFRHEKLRALGRPVHMPLLSILLSANGSNFSQSRVDLNVLYERGLTNRHGKLERHVLNPMVRRIEREASLATFQRSGSLRFVLGRRKPKDIHFTYGWEPLGHANPKDYATAVEKLLALRLTSPQIELAKRGVKPESVLRDWERWNEIAEECGLSTEHRQTNEEPENQNEQNQETENVPANSEG